MAVVNVLLRFFGKKALFIFLIMATLPGQAWSGNFDKGILWQVSKPGQTRSYILGTIHSDDPTVTNLPRQVKKALSESKSFTAELDLDMSAMLQAQMQMFLPNDQSLKKIVGLGRYRKCVNLMSGYGVPEMMVDRMKPWAIAAQLSMPKPKSGVFLDIKLYQLAQQRGFKLHGLETVSEQMGVFESMTEEQQLLMLSHAIRDYPSMPQKVSRLIAYYRDRDLRGMMQYSEEELNSTDPELKEIMEERLINARNQRMVERMQPQLVEGLAFIAVGALHLPGNKGILQLLEDRGYRVEAVY